MIRVILLVTAGLLLAACQNAPSRQAMWSQAPPPELPVTRPVPARMLLLPIDLRVHEISAGNVVEKVDAWSRRATETAEAYVRTLDSQEDGLTLVAIPPLSGDEQAALDQHVALYDAVALTAYLAQRATDPVWRKRGEETDFTLGPGLKALAEKSGADAALVIIGTDYISSGGRKAAMAVTSVVGALIGIGIVPQGGQAFVSAGIFDLRTGQLLWFDTHRSGSLDLNEEKGVRAVLDAVFRTAPIRKPPAAGDAKSG
ncbi:MAG: hypothetical protein U1F52_12890 [Burkholderiales bacterium]